jgi:tripartite ATP-independent transporter DctP family solute receptor
MKKINTLKAVAILVGGVIFSSYAHSAVRLRVAGNFPADHSVSRAMQVFKTEIETASNGEVKVDLFPAMQLGGATENVDQVRSGSIFAVFTSIAYFSRSVPEYEAVSLPFLFNNREQAFQVMDGPLGKQLDSKMAEQGYQNLGYGELGFRHVTNSLRPIKSVEDFKGLRIRLQPNEVHLQTFRALGANPVSMDVSELYSALQQGVMDAQENPYNIISSRRFNEVQKHFSNTGHFYDFINVAANKRKFDKLSDENKAIVSEAVKKAMLWQRETAAKEEESWRQRLVDDGMIYTPISTELRGQLRDATLSVSDSIKERVNPEFVDAVLKVVSEAK